MTTLGDLSIGDTFLFEIGGPRFTAYPELPPQVDVPVQNEIGDYRRVSHKMRVYEVQPPKYKRHESERAVWIGN